MLGDAADMLQALPEMDRLYSPVRLVNAVCSDVAWCAVACVVLGCVRNACVLAQHPQWLAINVCPRLQNEVNLLREILEHVEGEHGPEEGDAPIRLAHVLRAYEAVLNRAQFQPANDTFFYRYQLASLESKSTQSIS